MRTLLIPCGCLLALVLAGSPAQTQTHRWENAIREFEAADRTHPPPRHGILFVGSSSIRLWKTLARDFDGLPVINRGFGGSELADAVRYFERIVEPHAPRHILLYAGTNDINAGKDPETVFADFKVFVAKVRAALPKTRVSFIAIAPNPARWAKVDLFRRANALVQAYCAGDPQLEFIDVFTPMLGANGLPKAGIYSPDRLHMNAEGYALWTRIIQPRLK
ncbi:MAG: hypothetical protein JXQ71_08450 [Verrucomicrobia bacterium]|nr:hypothetical protein [Verrucomicrobiota bacterium]